MLTLCYMKLYLKLSGLLCSALVVQMLLTVGAGFGCMQVQSPCGL